MPRQAASPGYQLGGPGQKCRKHQLEVRHQGFSCPALAEIPGQQSGTFRVLLCKAGHQLPRARFCSKGIIWLLCSWHSQSPF